MIRGRLHRNAGAPDGEAAPAADTEVLMLDTSGLGDVFSPPGWLRDAGLASWLLVGVVLIIVATVWLLGLTSTIVFPVITAAIVAAVAAPLVSWLSRHRVPRGAAAALVLLLIAGIATAVFVIVLAGITSEMGSISDLLKNASAKITAALEDLGVSTSTAGEAKQTADTSVSDAASALLSGLIGGASKIASLAFFLSLTALVLFFMLKDGPSLRAWGERHAGVPLPIARTITDEVLRAMRGYFQGVTVVAAFNAVVIGGAAVIMDVPLAGTIAIVTFLGAYIPYFGAWIAGAFAVLLAYSAQGSDGALTMAIVALLANGVLQQMVQPIAMGAALNLHPLAVLIITIAAGALFGAIGLVISAPLASAIVQISHRLSEAGEAAKSAPGAAVTADPPVPPPVPA